MPSPDPAVRWVADPRRAVVRRFAVILVMALSALGVGAWWAMVLPAATPLPSLMTGPVPGSPEEPSRIMGDAALWNVTLWRSLGKEAEPPVVAVAGPQAITVSAILRRGATTVVALDVPGETGPVFIKVGEEAKGIAVVAVTAGTVDLRIGGDLQRVAVAP